MMLTSVSSISTTIESNSERAAGNFIEPVPHDKVAAIERRPITFRQEPPFLHHLSTAREPTLRGQYQRRRQICRPRRKRRTEWRAARTAGDWSKNMHGSRTEQRVFHRADSRRD